MKESTGPSSYSAVSNAATQGQGESSSPLRWKSSTTGRALCVGAAAVTSQLSKDNDMSMNCYFTIAYGVAAEGDIPETLTALMNDDCEAVVGPGIRAATGYNEGTGKDTWSIVLDRTAIRCDHRGEVYSRSGSTSVVGVTKLESPTYGEVADLVEVLNALKIRLDPSQLFLVDVL